MARMYTLVIALIGSCLSAPSWAQNSREDLQERAERPYDGPLIVERAVSGVHVCTNMTNGTPCGEDRWTMAVHSDGTRMIRSTMGQSESGTQINMVMHSDAKTFWPINAFASVYLDVGWLGAGQYAVKGDKLHVSVNTPVEHFTETLDLPENFTLLLHPISADGWHYGANYDITKRDVQMHNVCTLGAAGRSVHCAINPIALEFVGMEEITVPAGIFDTEHYRFGESTDVWITGRTAS